MRKTSEMYKRSGGTDYRHVCAECKNMARGKCKAYGITEGPETDWKQQWIACKFFNETVKVPVFTDTQREIDGQISIFDLEEA